MKPIQRIIVSGGGTGGHIYPALALIERLMERSPQLEVLYIGTKKGLEATIVPKAGINFKTVEIQGLKRSLSLENLRSVWLMLTSTHQAKRIIKDFKPDIVLGTGGYVCAPVLYAAAQLKIPTLIHEQNSVAGITNKFLARVVNGIAICFKEAGDDFSKYSQKLRLIGNPRGQQVIQTPADRSILQQQFQLDPERPTVLFFGGSRGAPAINRVALSGLDHWVKQDYQTIIVTGQVHYDEILEDLQGLDLGDHVRVLPYIDNMPAVFQAIDLVVCRSGATTLTELTALGLPSILIPSPYVTNNHQEHNAMSLVKAGAAMMMKEDTLSVELMTETIDQLLNSPQRLQQMQTAARSLGITDASDRMIQWMEELVN